MTSGQIAVGVVDGVRVGTGVGSCVPTTIGLVDTFGLEVIEKEGVGMVVGVTRKPGVGSVWLGVINDCGDERVGTGEVAIVDEGRGEVTRDGDDGEGF